MKTTFVLIISLLGFYFPGRAQDTANNLSTKRNPIFYFVIESKNSKPVIIRDLLIGRNDEVKERILSKDSAQHYLKNIKADYIFIVELKPWVKLLNIVQLFDKYQIDKHYRNFQVLWDGIETVDSKTLLASEDHIKDVTVDTNKKQIHIITNDHDKILEMRRHSAEDRAKWQKLNDNSK